MRIYGFELLHERAIWEGYVTAENEEEARQKILNKEWDEIVNEYDVDEFVDGYRIADIW